MFVMEADVSSAQWAKPLWEKRAGIRKTREAVASRAVERIHVRNGGKVVAAWDDFLHVGSA